MVWPDAQFLLAGGGAYGEAIADLAAWLGWHVTRVDEPITAAERAGALGPGDAAVVVGHDFATTGATLLAALSSDAGYVAALGSATVRPQRVAWLAARGVTDLTRLHMPAGLDLAAESPREVALAVLAEAHAARAGRSAQPLSRRP